MEKSINMMLVESVVKKALVSIKDSPKRGIRNLIDMALQFSDGRFQKNFFSLAQTMLQNENSAYYNLVRDTVAYADSDRLVTFGMNLGYNSCTEGARRIRANEEKLNCMIPWTISFRINTQNFEESREKYDALICEGESLGIYTWMIFAANNMQRVLSLAENHPDSAFCVFCETDNISAAFLDEVADLYNVMLVIRCEESATDLYPTLKEMGMLYSVWYPYGQKDTEAIINGELFASAQQLSPIFTVLVPNPDCPKEISHPVYQTVKQVRNDQIYHTLAFELYEDNRLIDSIISGDACCIYFDENGDLCDRDKKFKSEHHNLFESSLTDILMSACPKDMEAQT